MCLILMAMMILGITACGGGTDSEKSSSSKSESGSFQPSEKLDADYACTIDVLGPWGNFEALDQAAQDFKKFYPNIEVVYSPLNDEVTDLKNRMASGKGIDIYMTNWLDTHNESRTYLWENARDLSQVGLNLDAVDSDMLNTGYVDGVLKLMPVYRRMYGFMVNEDLLDEYGLTVPETYEAFLNCCETFKKEGIAPVLLQGSNNLTNTYNQHIVAKTMSSENGDTVMKEALEGKDSSGFVEDTLRMMADLFGKGYVHPDSNTFEDEYESVILRFFEGDIPFVPYNSEMYSGTRKREAKSEAFMEEPFHYSFIPFPGETGYECVYQQLGTVYMGIYDGIEEEKSSYVVELLRYLLSEEGSYTLEHVKNMPGTNGNTGCSDFPYFKKLDDGQVYVVGKDGLSFEYSELLTETHVNYEEDISAEEYLGRALDYIDREN